MNKLQVTLRNIVADVAEIENIESILPETHLQQELGVNSMQGLEIILLVEETLGIQVSQQALYEIQTFQDIISLARAGLEVTSSGAGPR